MGLEVKFKKLVEHAIIPETATRGAAGLDLVAIDYKYDHDHDFHEYGTGLSVEIPEGYQGYIFPRSSISNTSMSLANSVGVIDCDYRGELILRFRDDDQKIMYAVGDRIGQLVILPTPKIYPIECKELSNTERGVGGFGSTGN